MHSVPRLMPGQGVIVGVGAITYPPEYEGADPQTLAELGVSKVVTLTSTYDHRIIQGAESGELLAAVHDLLRRRATASTTTSSRASAFPTSPRAGRRTTGPFDGSVEGLEKVIAVQQLINMYRVRGHLIANLDPLGLQEAAHAPGARPDPLGPHDLGPRPRVPDRRARGPVDDEAPRHPRRAARRVRAHRSASSTCTSRSPTRRPGSSSTSKACTSRVDVDDKHRDPRWLNAAEAFERFLHTKFLGQKRFSLEGAETLIPMLDFLLDDAADAGMQEVVMGMSHRGRLNVLANIVGKSYAQIFREFEGELDPNVPQGSGDVKYHVGATGKFTASLGRADRTSRSPRTRATSKRSTRSSRAWREAKQDRCNDDAHDRVLSVLIHGDAAFAGQGVVAETLNLSELPGYDVGGTVHIVVNNQVGFTTTPGFARSTVYATDIAKAVQAPIFHVNGDDPEAACASIRLAFAFRKVFKKDVVVDMVCYRRYGHNEGDEPAFTQPRMYEVIGQAPFGPQALHRAAREPRRPHARRRREGARRLPRPARSGVRRDARRSARPQPTAVGARRVRTATVATLDTGVPRERLERIVDALTTFPDGFEVHPKLARIIGNRRTEFDETSVDWSLAEALAFGSLLLEGTPVRLAGQDTRRGTFSQRHAVLVDHRPKQEYTPLAHLGDDAAPFMIYDSVLSEFAALGFEYGYSVADRDALVCWEAQFGDFGNGAQTIIDQFIVAAEDKWGQRSGLVLLLPHGFEGQGPEHSSARLERFLVLVRRGQHPRRVPHDRRAVLPRAAPPGARPDRKPMIVMTPKRYLRMPATVLAGRRRSSPAGSSSCSPTPPRPTRASVTRLVFCTGKFGHELIARRDEVQAPVAIVRLEQLYPWPRARHRRRARALPERGGHLGPGRAGQHGCPLLRAPPHRGDVRRPHGRRRRPPREPEPRDRQLHRPRRRAESPARRRDASPSRFREMSTFASSICVVASHGGVPISSCRVSAWLA